jgi:protein phosphatase
MGGGANASRIAIRSLQSFLKDDEQFSEQLQAAARHAHEEILRVQKTNAELRRMATTLTATAFTQQGLFGIHCGDTRAAIARGNGVRRLTTDHSEGQRLFQAGKITKEELQKYPRKNILESALGSQDTPQIDSFRMPLLRGDKVFLTSDGAHGKLLLREMRDLAARHSQARSFVAEAAEIIAARSPDDNFSIVAVFVL